MKVRASSQQKQNEPQWALAGATKSSVIAPTPDHVLRVMQLQRTIGNHAVLRLLRANTSYAELASSATAPAGTASSRKPLGPQTSLKVQTKLMVSAPGDIYEQEADQIADQVIAAPAHSAVCGAPPHIQRLSGDANAQIDVAPASVDHVLAGPGRLLEPAVRQDMEQRFGYDFSTVRVHSGAAAEQSAREVNAHAYTVGQNIVFGAGRFAPGTRAGQRLLAHELTHVVQQSGTNGNRGDQSAGKCGLPSRRTQADARLLVTLSSPLGIAREPEDEDEEFRRHTREDKAERRRDVRRTGKQTPPTGAQVTRDAARQIETMINEARQGAYRHVNTPNRQRATNKLRQLLDNYRASEIQRIDSQLETTPAGDKRKALVAQKRAIVMERVRWQQQFDEAMRTPAGADAQAQYVRGGAAHEYHETRPGVGGYAQPDFSVTASTQADGATRYHVNLKAHDQRDLTLADARAIAREVTAQATSNALGDPNRRGHVGHLPAGDQIIISFIDQPDHMIQAEMNRIMLAEDSPITEVRFGTATHRRGGLMPLLQVQRPGPAMTPAPNIPSPGSASKDVFTMVRPASPMDVHQGSPILKPTSPMDVHTPSRMPPPKSPMDAPFSPSLPKGSIFEKYTLPKGSIFETKPASPMDVRQGSPMLRPTSPIDAYQGFKMPAPTSPMDVHQGSPIPKPTSPMDVAQVSPVQSKSLPKINLSDYPPDGKGPISGHFKDGAAISNITTAVTGITAAASIATDTDISLLGLVEWHYGSAVDEASKELQTKYPDTQVYWHNAGMDQLTKNYNDAVIRLNVSQATTLSSALASVASLPETQKNRGAALRTAIHAWRQRVAQAGGSDASWQNYLAAADAYMSAVFVLQEQLGDSPWTDLPAIADDIGRRASVLSRVGTDLEKTFWELVSSPLGMTPLTYYPLFNLLHAAGVLKNLGGRLGNLAANINARAKDYQHLWNQLQANLETVSNITERLSSRYGLKIPKS
jgi:uncharacterized protein YdbL (DUF1318 family)